MARQEWVRRLWGEWEIVWIALRVLVDEARIQLAASALRAGQGVVWVGQLLMSLMLCCFGSYSVLFPT
jgi:hypothetical protein